MNVHHLSNFISKILSKNDFFLNDRQHFCDLCDLHVAHADERIISKLGEKNPHFSTRVNACGSALTSTAVLKQAL